MGVFIIIVVTRLVPLVNVCNSGMFQLITSVNAFLDLSQWPFFPSELFTLSSIGSVDGNLPDAHLTV